MSILYISLIIPTLNSSKTLVFCLDSIARQDYPHKFLEVIFADGGSMDETLKIIEEFKAKNADIFVKIVVNKLKTGEAGKAAALKVAIGDILAFIDSDNILEEESWLSRMTEPFTEEDIIASEPIRYTYRKQDNLITRYCALMGMNDPLCYFLGNYDRECILSNRWTQMPYDIVRDNRSYLSLKLDINRMPTIGANGFLIRREEIEKINIGDFLFDIDILPMILNKNPMKLIAKVRIGIVHLFADGFGKFFLKQKRRISDFRHFSKKKNRAYNWREGNIFGLFYFCLASITLIPLLWQSVKGFVRKQDLCWFIHPILCLITFYVYVWGTAVGFQFNNRLHWQANR